ncbi:hypothetical protein [Rathayibacter sp. VKM Ac-2927]|uniref:hypothetical protein n=1 Tax=Rathayibacter sp. VKM Ac-2927 TaxID=2929478 RepID=UPI001FB2E37A|nr:hypothetical protein [Rathayibacter sp. VKM Ac-2927]MCJ1687965.1 hypothetical protein [Rathayibacter sp. VKM Ac-2927]
MASEARTRAARARAEDALVRFALLAGAHAQDFVVIGGLNPDFLAPSAPAAHLGTTDVDLLFELGFVYDREELDFGWLDRVLRTSGFRARRGAAGWQWDAVLGDALVRLDLLCDVVDQPGQTVSLPGAESAAVQNLEGPAAALVQPILRELSVSPRVRADHVDAPDRVELRFASLAGYLTAKSAALLSRSTAKDAYDLMFVVLFNPGGPREAAQSILELPAVSYRRPPAAVARGAVSMLLDPQGRWAGHFAAQMRGAGDEELEERLRADAAAGASLFLRTLDQNA